MIHACLRCGSRELRAASIREGAIPGLAAVSGQTTCRSCGHTGPALEFDDEEAWRAFRDAVR